MFEPPLKTVATLFTFPEIFFKCLAQTLTSVILQTALHHEHPSLVQGILLCYNSFVFMRMSL